MYIVLIKNFFQRDRRCGPDSTCACVVMFGLPVCRQAGIALLKSKLYYDETVQ